MSEKPIPSATDAPGEPADNRFHTQRFVKLMADYCASGVWDRDGVMAEIEDLPISPSLAVRIVDWQAHFEISPIDGRFSAWGEADTFVAEGLAIARALKAELPDWTVTYVDEGRLDAAVNEAWNEKASTDGASSDFEGSPDRAWEIIIG